MEEAEKNTWYYHTFVQMNKPMKFMGFSSYQLFIVVGLLGVVVIVCTSFLKTKFIVPLLIDGMLFVPAYMISKKLTAEHKRGNSNYFGSYVSYMSTPRKVIDKNKIFSFLINE